MKQNIRVILNAGMELNNLEELVRLTELMINSFITSRSSRDLSQKDFDLIQEIRDWESEEAVKLAFFPD